MSFIAFHIFSTGTAIGLQQQNTLLSSLLHMTRYDIVYITCSKKLPTTWDKQKKVNK